MQHIQPCIMALFTVFAPELSLFVQVHKKNEAKNEFLVLLVCVLVLLLSDAFSHHIKQWLSSIMNL